jgi:hypothetical protein
MFFDCPGAKKYFSRKGAKTQRRKGAKAQRRKGAKAQRRKGAKAQSAAAFLSFSLRLCAFAGETSFHAAGNSNANRP